MRDVAVVGVGMTRFGKFPDKGIKELVREAVTGSMKDSGARTADFGAAYVGNAAAGLMTGQEMIRGQVTLSPLGIEGIPVFNVENACASSSTAFHLGWQGVASGAYDCVLVVGFEKLFHPDKQRSFRALSTGIDVESGGTFLQDFAARKGQKAGILQAGSGTDRSIFMDMYTYWVRPYMEKYGLTREHFARISVKNHRNGSRNPHAQYQNEVTMEEVLASGEVVFPLTRMMCAPIGDGAAACVLCSRSVARKLSRKPVWVAASKVGSGSLHADEEAVAGVLAPGVFEQAGIGPEDVDVIEVHDATAPSEIMSLIQLGICPGDDACKWIEEGALEITGAMPTNPSGGLETKGHPVGATGAGQIFEIVTQLRGEAGGRQVQAPRTGMTHNGGGILGADAAAMALHVFKR
ncbi:MAG: thiolase family protein [Deltaproteobacteria bacterium]|nr:thiolase family protein [Deltaproteobacteria bacterium]